MNPVDYLELYQRCGYLEYKIRNLLSHHHITILNEDTMYRVLMSGTGVDDNGIPFEGRIRVAEFARIPKNMEQEAMRGEVNINDIIAERDDSRTDTG